MSAQNELYALAEVIGNKAANVKEIGRIAAAKRVLDAGYRKPRTVSTIDELNELPRGSVVLDRDGLSLHLSIDGWCASNGTRGIESAELEREAFPALVLHEAAA